MAQALLYCKREWWCSVELAWCLILVGHQPSRVQLQCALSSCLHDCRNSKQRPSIATALIHDCARIRRVDGFRAHQGIAVLVAQPARYGAYGSKQFPTFTPADIPLLIRQVPWQKSTSCCSALESVCLRVGTSTAAAKVVAAWHLV